ncbi:MAG: transporter [Vicinamibacterales bacterium]
MVRWSSAVLAAGCCVLHFTVVSAQGNLTCDLAASVLVCPAAGSPRSQLETATLIAGSEATGATFAQAVSLEVATAPLGSSSGGFVYTFDRATRGQRRTSASFGPAFAERALTIGQGNFSGGFNVLKRSYDTFGDVDLDKFEVFRFIGGGELAARSSQIQLRTDTETTAIFGHVGVLNNLDVGVMVPYIHLTLDGVSQLFTDSGGEVQRVLLRSSTQGFGDLGIFTKFKFAQFGAPPGADAGPNAALALAATFRLPTGSKEELRGLGVGRALLSLVASGAAGRFSPHVNVGYEFWTDSVVVPQDFQGLTTLASKDQVQYAGGVEVEVTRRLTLVGDVLGRFLRGTGQVGYQPFEYRQNPLNIQGANALVAAPNGVHSIYAVPGVKWNFYADALLNFHALVSLTREGLRDRITPVIGIDWGF